MKIELEQPKRLTSPNEQCRIVSWKRALPFLYNPRGCLIHRVRFAVTVVWDGVPSHDYATYWCGNDGHGEFVAEPPAGRLLCATCEAQAAAHGQPSAEELVGRHVCIGKMRAVRLCCQSDGN